MKASPVQAICSNVPNVINLYEYLPYIRKNHPTLSKFLKTMTLVLKQNIKLFCVASAHLYIKTNNVPFRYTKEYLFTKLLKVYCGLYYYNSKHFTLC